VTLVYVTLRRHRLFCTNFNEHLLRKLTRFHFLYNVRFILQYSYYFVIEYEQCNVVICVMQSMLKHVAAWLYDRKENSLSTRTYLIVAENSDN